MMRERVMFSGGSANW